MIRNFGSVQGLKGQPQGFLLGLGTGGNLQPPDAIVGKKFTNDNGEQTGTGANAKRYATGTGTTDSNGYITVTGLAFQPGNIIVEQNRNTSIRRSSYYYGSLNSALNNWFYENITNSVFNLMTNWDVQASGFSLRTTNFAGDSFKWTAYEQ